MHIIRTGLDRLIESPPPFLAGQRLGLLCNPASVNREFCHARDLIHRRFPGQLAALYSPQHGFFADKQDNMVESGHMTDPVLKIPVFSLYGERRQPTLEMFDPIDVLLVDIQDVGTRVYTFIYTISYCMEAAAAFGKKVVILDRPNPVGGLLMEGNCLLPEYASFVGRYPIPMRHAMTVGELARLFNTAYGIGCDLDMIPMQGWSRKMYFRDTGLPWVAPSPNLPTPESAMVYPGQVLWEGTNVSEGRGTTQPFELFGAPFLNMEKILRDMGGNRIPGAILRPAAFEPTFGKWAKTFCRGFQIHVTDPDQYRPWRTTLALLQAILRHHREDFTWKQPPYEYEFERMPIDLIIGSREIRERLENLESLDSVEADWQEALGEFGQMSREFYLY